MSFGPLIVFWTRLPLAREAVTERLRAEPGIRLTVCATLAECLRAVPAADGLILYNCPPGEARELMEAVRGAPGLKWMHFISAGKEGFNAEEFPPRITVTQIAGASAPVVAEHAMALLLALGRRIPDMQERQARQAWDRWAAPRMQSLEGKTLAIVGYGHIGREVARRARGFGMHIAALSRNGHCDELADEGQPLSALADVLARADAIVVTIAQTPQTVKLLGAAVLARCKPNALLVNVARGGVIDHAALEEALTQGRLGGAALDVTEPEPLPSGHPLWNCPSLILSSHLAVEGSSATEQRLADGTMALLRRFMAGEAMH